MCLLFCFVVIMVSCLIVIVVCEFFEWLWLLSDLFDVCVYVDLIWEDFEGYIFVV